MAPATTTSTPIDWIQNEVAARDPETAPILSTAETAACSCPDFCERDHDRD